MRLRYNKMTGRRLWGALEWSATAGRVREVDDADLVVALLLQPQDQFSIDASEPLLKIAGVNPDVAGNLALAGVGSVQQLAAYRKAGIKDLAKSLKLPVRVVGAWVRAAAALCEAGLDQTDDGTRAGAPRG